MVKEYFENYFFILYTFDNLLSNHYANSWMCDTNWLK